MLLLSREAMSEVSDNGVYYSIYSIEIAHRMGNSPQKWLFLDSSPLHISICH